MLGVVSRRDLLRLLARPDPEIARDVEAALAEALPADRWRVTVSDGLAELQGTWPWSRPRVLRPMRGFKRLRSAAVIAAGHAFIQNIRRGHYELAADAPPLQRLTTTFAELVLAI